MEKTKTKPRTMREFDAELTEFKKEIRAASDVFKRLYYAINMLKTEVDALKCKLNMQPLEESPQPSQEN